MLKPARAPSFRAVTTSGTLVDHEQEHAPNPERAWLKPGSYLAPRMISGVRTAFRDRSGSSGAWSGGHDRKRAETRFVQVAPPVRAFRAMTMPGSPGWTCDMPR